MLIASSHPGVVQMRGLHLFHHGLSSCSQRVRITLEEKKQNWTSHVVNLAKDEHLSNDFLNINPKGLVPVLVHDGQVHVESMDIVAYLNRVLSGVDLLRADDEVQPWVARCDALQGAIKIATFEFLFKPVQKKSEAKLARYARLEQNNPELLAFHRRFSSAQGLGESRIKQAVSDISQSLEALDQQLAGQCWIAGSQFSLADIVWMVNAHRLALMIFPDQGLPHYRRWLAQVNKRASYQQALLRWEAGIFRGFFHLYSQYRRCCGSDIRAYL